MEGGKGCVRRELWMGNRVSSPEMEAEIAKIIAENVVVVFSKTYCGFCKAVKKLLKDLGVKDMMVVELDVVAKGSEMQNALRAKTGQSTVPSVWIGGEFIGGSDDTSKLHRSGGLVPKLQAVNAVA
mmetsp:Transcript_9497/g.20021  ORF Transcript_9497/g.20021 Transcript_9497/m.20021 type:complete len:126 (+) Transcript_9497:62-439(+)